MTPSRIPAPPTATSSPRCCRPLLGCPPAGGRCSGSPARPAPASPRWPPTSRRSPTGRRRGGADGRVPPRRRRAGSGAGCGTARARRRRSTRTGTPPCWPGSATAPGPHVMAPLFERDLEQPLAGAIAVPAAADLVVTEGNYLLLDDPPWRAVRAQLDAVWHVGHRRRAPAAAAGRPARGVRQVAGRRPRLGRAGRRAQRAPDRGRRRPRRPDPRPHRPGSRAPPDPAARPTKQTH